MAKTALMSALTLTLVMIGLQAWAQTPIPPSPKDFAMAAAQSDQYEILAAHVAVVQGQDPRVRSFAEAMIRDHLRLTEELRKAAQSAGLPALGSGMSNDQAALLSGLQSLQGTDFDKAYARQQVLAHTQAVAVEDSFAAAGADVNLKKAAQTSLPTIRSHLKMAEQLREELGG